MGCSYATRFLNDATSYARMHSLINMLTHYMGAVFKLITRKIMFPLLVQERIPKDKLAHH